MQKGINTAIEETKVELLNLVNSKLQMGVPISVMGLIVNNLLTQINNETLKIVKQEEAENKKAEEVKSTEVVEPEVVEEASE